MSLYGGRFAELYDLFYEGKPYATEASFIHWCINEYAISGGRSLLEIACGTGTHAFELEKFGYQITAADYSDSMLAVARLKAKRLSSLIAFHNQDMRFTHSNLGSFDAVICLFDSIGYVVSNDALNQTLQGVNRCLKDGGIFIFEFWNAGAILRHYERVRVKRWLTAQGEILRISETTLDYFRQVCNVTYNLLEINNDGTSASMKETHTNRFFLIQEMDSFLERNDFIPLKWFAGFSQSETINEDTWHILAVARRK